MNSLWNTSLLLAYRDPRLDGIASGFRQRQTEASSTSMVVLLLVFACVVIVFWMMVRFTDRHQRQQAKSHPWRLFFSLGRAHRLRWVEMWFLWRLARQQHPSDPARVFLEPERLESARATVRTGPRWDVVNSLHRRLFVELHENASPPRQSGEAGTATLPEASIPLSPECQEPQLDLPPWPQTSGDLPSAMV